MAALEIMLAYDWLDSRLHGDSQIQNLAPGGVWFGMAAQRDGVIELPQTDSYPVLLFRFVNGSFAQASGGRINANLLWDVYGVTQGEGIGDLVPLAERVDQLLDDQANITVTGGQIESCQAERPIITPLFENRTPYRVLGASYRIFVSREET